MWQCQHGYCLHHLLTSVTKSTSAILISVFRWASAVRGASVWVWTDWLFARVWLSWNILLKKTLSFFVNITLLVWLWPYLTTAEIFIQLVFWSAIKVIALRPHLYKPGHMCHHSAQTCRNSSWSFSSSEVCLAARRLGAPGADWVTGVDARLIKDVLLTFVAALKRQDAAIFPHYVGRQVGSPMDVVADSVVMAEFDPGRLEQRSEKMDVQNRLCLKWH